MNVMDTLYSIGKDKIRLFAQNANIPYQYIYSIEDRYWKQIALEYQDLFYFHKVEYTLNQVYAYLKKAAWIYYFEGIY